MNGRIWCEGPGEFQFFDREDFTEVAGVLVHTVEPRHTTDGTLVELTLHDLDVAGVAVDLGELDVAAREHREER